MKNLSSAFKKDLLQVQFRSLYIKILLILEVFHRIKEVILQLGRRYSSYRKNETVKMQNNSHGVLSTPFSGRCLIFGLVSLIDMGNLWHKRIVGVGICEKRTDGEQHLGDGQCWRPLLFQNVQTDGTIGVDVWVVDPGGEIKLSRLERIVCREVDVEEENSTSIGRIIWSHDGSLPVILVLLVDWSSGAVGGWIFSKVDEFFLNSLDGRHLLTLLEKIN